MLLPEALILSTQRSGTHLLESFLTKHPQIVGQGELFNRYHKLGILERKVEGKLNIGILMYNQMYIFEKLGGAFINHKIIHLIRNPYNVALSRLQMTADKAKQGNLYKAHYHNHESINERGVPDLSKLIELTNEINAVQQKYIELLKDTNHLLIKYEDFVKNDENAVELDEDVQSKILQFLCLENVSFKLYTTYIKTGIVSE
ncbi:MAG TPA: sulfotransferase domain-containing protein [Bacteroidales bacterium]